MCAAHTPHATDFNAIVRNGFKFLKDGHVAIGRNWEQDSKARRDRVRRQHELERNAYAQGCGALTPNNS